MTEPVTADTVEVDFTYVVRVRATLSRKDWQGADRADLLADLGENIEQGIHEDVPYEEPEPGDLIQQMTSVQVIPAPAGWAAADPSAAAALDLA